MANKKVTEKTELSEELNVNDDAEKNELAPAEEKAEPKTKKEKILSGLKTAGIFLLGAGAGVVGTMFLGKKKNSDDDDDVDYSYEETN